MTTASGRVFRCRSVVQQLVGPALQDAPVEVRRQHPTPRVQDQSQAEPAVPLPHPERLAQQRDRPGRAHPPQERHAPLGQRQPARRHHQTRRQLLQPQPAAVLRRRLAPQPRVGVLRVHRLLRPRRLPPQVARPLEVPLEQGLLEPAFEVLPTAVELRLPFRDEHGADAEAPAQPDHPRQGPRRGAPAAQRAGVVELDLRGPTQVLPAFAEEAEDLVHPARFGQAQANGPVERVLADPAVVALPPALEVNRPDPIDLVEFVGGASRGPGYSWRGSSGARRTGGAVRPLRWSTRSMVRGLGKGRKPSAVSSVRMAVAPIKR
jgi:hypothetical protein